MKNSLAIILVAILGIGCGFGAYYLIDNQKSNDTPKQEEQTNNNVEQEYISYCNNNKTKIFNSISNLRNISFDAKYNKDNFVEINVNNIICDSTSSLNDNQLEIEVKSEVGGISNTELFVYNIEESSANYLNGLDGEAYTYDEHIAVEAFVYAKTLVDSDLNEYRKSHPNFELGTYRDENYNGNDIYILKICEYEGEGRECSKHYYDYRVDFKNKTFEKINIDVK